MKNRIVDHAKMIQTKIDELDTETVAKLDADMDITFEEHFRFQTKQAHSHAAGILTTEEATVIYRALGESMSAKNGGWQPGVSTATKVTITKIMAELFGLSK